jgi:regulator of protease activity HflC (stomatin/prohibitin superfamily)
MTSSPPHSDSDAKADSYQGANLVLLAMALLGALGAFGGGMVFSNPVLLDAAVILTLSAGALMGVLVAQRARARPQKPDQGITDPAFEEGSDASPSPRDAGVADDPKAGPLAPKGVAEVGRRLRELGAIGNVRIGTAATGVLLILRVLVRGAVMTPPALLAATIAAFLCLVAAGLAATAARYFAGIEPTRLPEAPGLSRGARVVAWVLVMSAVSMGFACAGLLTLLGMLHFAVLAVAAAICLGLFRAKPPDDRAVIAFPLNLGVLSILGSRANILASVLDAAEGQLGIDLRSTWALALVRRSLEPVVIGLCLLGWLSTALTVVALEEQGLVERLGVPLAGAPLEPGLHLHWPWPVDRVFRIPVRRVQALTVGHEGDEAAGPEDVLWAREHAANEYTLLLGNGRDLITVDAAVQFRIADARAWLYHCQNPADALRAVAYRAVMRSTVNRTLSEALSENVVTLTGRMRAMVQEDADALGLGVESVAFTVGGMHPPVMVAPAYQAVVSAELGKVTAIVNAQAYRNQTVPAAEAFVVSSANAARADGLDTLARAAGEAWSFRTLESQYRVAPGDYLFRRRLETLENVLAGRRFTVVDARIQRDGGELWLMP